MIAGIGGWILGMRGMMVTVLGEDYLTLAEAKGLKNRRIFLRYAVRNAMLPQFTALAITLGYVVSGSVIVELIFSYPGMGIRIIPRHFRERFPGYSGHHFLSGAVHRHCNPRDRPDLSSARSAYHLQEELDYGCY